MAYIHLDEAKDHCRVDKDFYDDDIYITDLIDVAEQAVSNEIGDALADVLVSGELPKPIKQAILLVIGHLYNTREPIVTGTIVTKVPMTVEYLLAPYKTWTCE
jgi:uncharacterized phage protein (predicted DNA packaging)